MGEDKALLPFGGYATLAEYQYRRVSPLFKHTCISTKTDKFPFKATLVFDSKMRQTHAPTSGLIAVFKTLEEDAFFALGVDTPFVDESVIKKLVEAYEKEEADAIIAKSPNGIHPMCGIYTRKMLPRLEEMVANNQHRLGYLLKLSNTLFVNFQTDEPFFNLNYPEEYRTALKKSR
ncbi:molybdenum cofactor guanylyltransferase [Hydrogenimonas cancrithermarum]|uniref:Molybdenum cofactor guanylyltransferase n=2 Tax=Hydrogenimonas cancrithermarum TaxID=2993563 RepID=A0ABM8FKZ7_9BACT|nr:molybdenum cofactor guanylyltransferase [Hydrogenimonas cancrithermarum]BDY12997.1 molybdenum cofactor guanylyltransferase [Hydrogenimonas cancrithermarum]